MSPIPQQKSVIKKSLWPKAIALLAVVIVVGSGSAWFIHSRNKPAIATHVATTNTINYSPATKNDNSASDARKGSPTPSSTLDNGTSTTPATTGTSFSTNIVSANVNSGNVHIGTLVSGTTNGACTLTASLAGQQSLVRTSTVQLNVNNYDCGVFNIPTTSFPAAGTWKLTLIVTNNGQQASNSTTVNITSNT